MPEKIEISAKGIKQILKKYNYPQSIAEFIWNGFDAGATEVCLQFETNDLDGVCKISVSDNGHGIPQEALNQKFKPFFESEKMKESDDVRHHSLTHGKNGVGRLTFFTFSQKAIWTTRYKKDGKLVEYDIEISSKSPESYSGSDSGVRNSNVQNTGTTVVFEGIDSTKINQGELMCYLTNEFAWFLELFKNQGYSLKVDHKELNYETLIDDRELTKFTHKKNNTVFEVSYIRWNKKLENEYSKFYFIDAADDEVWKDNTKLNNKGDNFYHSIYIKSNFFDNFLFDAKQSETQNTLVGNSKNSEEYKFLETSIVHFLKNKRKPFLRIHAEKLIQQYEREGVIPDFKETWEQERKIELENIVKGLYQIQPKIFSTSTLEQKKTFVRLLNALLESDEREKLLEIIKEVVDLDSEERDELLALLKNNRLSNIIQTIKLINERYKIVNDLKELVFNPTLQANEPDHIQKMIDSHYWLFGEQYNLVTSTEGKFEEALRKYIYLLRGDKKKVKINHPDKNKEMDVFLCKWNKTIDCIENIVVELKHPDVLLGEKEVSQVLQYMRVILQQPEFNDPNMSWEFYLIGNRFNTSGYIESMIESNKPHGESKKGLIHRAGNYKVYVKTWSTIFAEFECKHKFLEEKLKLERGQISAEHRTAAGIVSEAQNSPAALGKVNLSLKELPIDTVNAS